MEGYPMARGNSFLFDASFFTTKEAALIEEAAGSDGLLAYIKILCLLRTEESHTLPINSKILAKLTKTSKKIIEKLLKICLEKNYFSEKNEEIFSEKINLDLQKLEEKKKKYRENANKRWDSEKENKKDVECSLVSNAMPLHCEDKVKEKVKEKDSFRKGSRETLFLKSEDLDTLEIPTCWESEPVRDALKLWLEYKTSEKREPYRTMAPIKTLLTNLKKSNPTTELVVYAINFAISNGWKGVGLYKNVLDAFELNAQGKEVDPIQEYKRLHGLIN